MRLSNLLLNFGICKHLTTESKLDEEEALFDQTKGRTLNECDDFLPCSSSETQGQIKGARESLNGQKNIYGTKKSKERREQPLGTMSYQTSSKWSPSFVT